MFFIPTRKQKSGYFQRDQNVQKWCRERDVKWVEMNPSSVMRGGDADRRRLKLRQADYRKQEPLPIPDFSHLEPLVPGVANQPPSWQEVTSSFLNETITQSKSNQRE